IGLVVDVADRERNTFAVGRDLWISDASNSEQGFDCVSPILGRDQRTKTKEQDGKQDNKTLHGSASSKRILNHLGKRGYYEPQMNTDQSQSADFHRSDT